MANTPLNSTATKDKENLLILQTLIKYKKPLTRRFISECTQIEIASLCRALDSLTNKRRILRVSLIAKCPKTNKLVYHYYFTKHVEGVLFD